MDVQEPRNRAYGGEDFIAASITNRENSPSLLLIADRANGMTLTPTFGADLRIAMTGTTVLGEVAIVDQGFIGQTTMPSSPDLTIEGKPGLGIYLVTSRSTQQTTLLLTYGPYLDTISAGIGLGGDIYNIGVLGAYSGVGTNTMTAGLMVTVLD